MGLRIWTQKSGLSKVKIREWYSRLESTLKYRQTCCPPAGSSSCLCCSFVQWKLLKAGCTWGTVLFGAQQAHCLVWGDCFHWIEAKPLEMMFALGSCLSWAEAGVVPGRSPPGAGGLPTFQAGRAPGTASPTGTLASLKRTRQRKLTFILICFLEALMCSCLPGSICLWNDWLAFPQHVTVPEMGNMGKETPEMSATCSPLGDPWVPTALCKLRKLSVTSSSPVFYFEPLSCFSQDLPPSLQVTLDKFSQQRKPLLIQVCWGVWSPFPPSPFCS